MCTALSAFSAGCCSPRARRAVCNAVTAAVLSPAAALSGVARPRAAVRGKKGETAPGGDPALSSVHRCVVGSSVRGLPAQPWHPYLAARLGSAVYLWAPGPAVACSSATGRRVFFVGAHLWSPAGGRAALLECFLLDPVWFFFSFFTRSSFTSLGGDAPGCCALLQSRARCSACLTVHSELRCHTEAA